MSQKQQNILIPISDLSEVERYQHAFLGVLRKIKIDPYDLQLKEDMKIMYQLLNHLYLGIGNNENEEKQKQPQSNCS